MMILPIGRQALATTKKNNLFRTRSLKSAFTLIELVFVMILLALLGGFAIPKMSNIIGLNNKSQVLKLAGFLQRAHQLALLQGKDFRVVLDLDQRSFWVEEQMPLEIKPLLPDEFKVDEVLMEFRKEAETYMDEEEVEKRKITRYQKYESKGLETGRLPDPLFIDSVYISSIGERVREGQIYIPISHAGYHPTTIIYVARKDDIQYSVIYPSLSASAKINKGLTTPEEIQW